MRYELQKKMMDNYPKLYRNRPAILTGDGWFNIIKELSDKLEKMIPETIDNDFKCFQVSERHGGLNFSMTMATDEMYKEIEIAEEKCCQTCEKCGNPGKFTKINGWRCILCENCY